MFADGGSPWLDGLNGAQRVAVEHEDGPLLVIAGAGTGKTRTLASRVAHLIANGTPPERILLLTFTRRAAREMLSRAERLTGPDRTGRVWGGTFHSVATRLLRMYGDAFGIPPNFTVMDQADAADLINLVRSEQMRDTGSRRFPKKDTLATIYSRTVNSQKPLATVLRDYFPWCAEDIDGIKAIFTAYTRRKREQAVLDYDDLLVFWAALAASDVIGRRVGGMFDHILVDEYQDTNGIQADILTAMRRTNKNLMVVGDDAQAIYSFRHASIEHILAFPDSFPNTTVVKLEQNYRSVKPILEVSNRTISLAKRRYAKTLWSEREAQERPQLITCADESHQTDLVCRTVLEHRERGVALMQQAVLFRTGHHSAPLEIELTRRNIPFVKFGGLKFVEAAHVKDVLGMMRILENPHDELSWFRVLQLIEGVGAATARRVMKALGVRRGTGPRSSPVRRLLDDPPAVPPAALEEFNSFRSALKDCVEDELPAAQIDRLGIFFEPIVHRTYDSPAARLADLAQMSQIAASYPSRAKFITDLTLEHPSETGDLAVPPHLDEDYLILSTIHSAKGGEWDVVHVIHASDGMIPSDMAVADEAGVEEERRLFYVALTRARNHLYVYWPLRYYHRRRGLDDGHGYMQLTRFIPESVGSAFDRLAPVSVDQDVPVGILRGEARSVDAALERLWS